MFWLLWNAAACLVLVVGLLVSVVLLIALVSGLWMIVGKRWLRKTGQIKDFNAFAFERYMARKRRG